MTISPGPRRRGAALRAALALCASLCWLALVSDGRSVRAHAAQPALRVSLAPKQHLARDAHTSIAVVVQLPAASVELPLLLTPHIEGRAVELVRGRLLRGDAKITDARQLRFEIPVVARSEGTAILRVSVATYLCDEACRRVESVASAVLDVR